MLTSILYFIGGAISLFVIGTIVFIKSWHDESTGTRRWKEYLKEEKRKKKFGGNK